MIVLPSQANRSVCEVLLCKQNKKGLCGAMKATHCSYTLYVNVTMLGYILTKTLNQDVSDTV